MKSTPYPGTTEWDDDKEGRGEPMVDMRRTKMAVTAVATVQAVRTGLEMWEQGKDLWARIQKLRTVAEDAEDEVWQITIGEATTRLFEAAQSWLLSLPSDTILRTWEATLDNDDRLIYLYTDKPVITATYQGHTLRFRMTVPDVRNLAAAEGWSRPVGELQIYAYSSEGVNAVKDRLEKLMAAPVRNSSEYRPDMYRLTRHGSWQASPNPPTRAMRTVVLADNQAHEIMTDMARFLEAAQFYADRGIPYHRGYFFYGPPGTGKTSFVKALVHHFRPFKLDLFVLSLPDVEGDSALAEHLDNMSTPAILFLDDVDRVFLPQMDGETELRGRVTLPAVLGMLDGLTTPNGVIIILSANDPDKIPDVLRRHGRVDKEVYFGYCTGTQVDQMYEAFYEHAPRVPFLVRPGSRITGAQVTDVFKTYLYEDESAEAELHRLLGTTPIFSDDIPVTATSDGILASSMTLEWRKGGSSAYPTWLAESQAAAERIDAAGENLSREPDAW